MPSWLRQYWQVKRHFTALLSPDRARFIFAMSLMAGVVATNTVLIWYLGQPFEALAQGRFTQIPELLASLAVIVVINQIFHWSTTVSSNSLGLRFVGRVRNTTLNNIVHISFPAMDRYAKGDVLARLSHDVNGLQNLLIETPLMFWSHLLTLVFYCSMLWWLHPPLALLALGLTPLFLLHQAIFNPLKRRIAQGFLAEHGRLLAFEDQSLDHLRNISTFNAESVSTQHHRERYRLAQIWAMKERRLDAAFTATFSIVIYGCGLAILFAGLHAVQANTLAIGALVSFLLYLGYLSVPVRGIVHLSFQAQADRASADRVLEIMRAPPRVENDGRREWRQVRGDIRFDNVSFRYDSNPVLEQVSLSVPAGATVALIGPSGAGKSTLAKLLLRFYEPDTGRILLDGEDIRQFTLSSLRRNVTVVWQNPLIYSATLRENLLLAKPDATDDELIRACTDAHAWEFIAGWPDTLDTMVGMCGVELSAGQAQRIAIAQGLLRDAPVLILDEPSSALDSESERQIVSALSRLRTGRTTLIIAHRFSSVRNANSVIYFNGDGSVSHATHDELLHSHAGYREAVRWQTIDGGAREITA